RGGHAIRHDLVIRDAAVGAYLGGNVVGAAVSDAAIQIRADGVVAVVGEAASEFLVQLVPTRHVVPEHDAGKRSVSFRPRDVRVDLIAVGGGDGRDARRDAGRSGRVERIPHTADATRVVRPRAPGHPGTAPGRHSR